MVIAYLVKNALKKEPILLVLSEGLTSIWLTDS